MALAPRVFEAWHPNPWTADDEAVVANWDNLLVAGARTGRWIPAVQNSRYVRTEVRRPQPTPTTPDTMVALTNPIFLGRLDLR